MLNEPMDILQQFPIRKSRSQKSAFRESIISYVRKFGYHVTEEKVSFGGKNIVIGDPVNAKYLITAHYDTPASIGLPNFITPCNPIIFIVVQILLLSVFFLAAFAAALITGLLTDDFEIMFLAAYIAYFGLLALMMFGPANRNNANDNTSGVVTVLEIAGALPEEFRDQVCFVLFDLEEAGLVGSSAYRKMHKKDTENQIILNLDCVGDGDEFVLFPTSKLRKDGRRMKVLEKLEFTEDGKKLWVRSKGFAYCPSDHKNFPYGVGIMAFHRKKVIGIYCDRIHTWRDTILERKNVETLRDVICNWLQSMEAAC